MNIAIYSRVSTDKQINDGFGIDVQKKELITEVEKQGYDYKEYTDKGISGTSMKKRKELQRLLDDVRGGAINEVWVTKLSRLGRNTRDVLNIIYEFEKHNVVFKSTRDGIDTSNSMGKVMLQFMSIVSEMERDIIIETTKAGLDYRASLGKIYGCPPIFGYNRIGSGKNSHIVINEEEAKIVKLIYKQYLNGNGYKAICNIINGKGLKTKDGNYFAINTVKTVLSNPLYVGKIRYNLHKDWTTKRRKGKQAEKDIIFVDGMHKNIISKVKWNRVQKKMRINRATKCIKTYHYLLTGLMKCPKCGSTMVGSKGSYKGKYGTVHYYYYQCSNYKNKGKIVCRGNRINATKLDNEVLSFLQKLLIDYNRKLKTELTESIVDLFESGDLIEIKKLLRVMLANVQYDYLNKKASIITMNFDEDLFEFLSIKFTKKKYREVVRNIDRIISLN